MDKPRPLDLTRRVDKPDVGVDADVSDLQKRTCHYLKLDGATPSIYVRYGKRKWTAKVGTSEVPVEEKNTLWTLERLFHQHTTAHK